MCEERSGRMRLVDAELSLRYSPGPEWVEEGVQMLGLPRLVVLHAHGVCRQGLDALRKHAIAVHRASDIEAEYPET